jgi:hypothetical protein
LDRCHFLKIDVEGLEQEVLEGASDTLRRFRPRLYVENDRLEKSAALIEHLLALDYRLFSLRKRQLFRRSGKCLRGHRFG